MDPHLLPTTTTSSTFPVSAIGKQGTIYGVFACLIYQKQLFKYSPHKHRKQFHTLNCICACTGQQIRAANLSGDCWFSKEAFGRFKFRWRAHQQVDF